MSHIGHTAARFNIFLDIPSLLRAMSQSLYLQEGPQMQISDRLWDAMQLHDPMDPTQVYEEYYGDWWNGEISESEPVEIDLEEGFKWHIEKVSKNILLVPILKLFPIGSTDHNAVINKSNIFQRQRCPTTTAKTRGAKTDYDRFWVRCSRGIRV